MGSSRVRTERGEDCGEGRRVRVSHEDRNDHEDRRDPVPREDREFHVDQETRAFQSAILGFHWGFKVTVETSVWGSGEKGYERTGPECRRR